MDPQIRMFLEVAHSALENAGYDVERMDGRVGVFASSGSSEYLEHHLHTRRDIVEHAESSINALNRNDYVATTVSYKLNLHGPSMTVQTACSSTLVALHLACRSLQIGECDIAIVGGADMDLAINRGYRWQPGAVSSRDGHVRTFDAEASGTRFSGGSAAVVLRRLSDAQSDDSRITAIVRATAVNNDGSDKVSFGAPSITGQRAAVTEAMRLAELKAADMSYVEAHGTGTVIGDPIEVTALNEAYSSLSDGPLAPESCAIGSVKSNLGHLGSVAGIIGFVKTALALEREQLPPTVNFTRPNPNLHLERTPFRINDRLTPWPRQAGRPRHAGLSALGVGGSNAHVILQEAPVKPHATHDGSPRLVVWSALDTDAAAAAQGRIADFLAARGDAVFADAVATLAHGRTRHAVRGAAVCTDADDAVTALRPGSKRVIGGQPPANRPVALLFPGQGSQAVAMAAGLYQRVPAFATAYDRCLDRFAEAGLDLRPSWRGDTGAPSVDDTLYAQPLLFSVGYALAEMWSAAGVTPSAVLGHSVGELVAATVAGVWTLADAVTVMTARARAIDAAEPGGMLAVAGDESVVADLLKPPLALAAVNSDRQLMLSGPEAELAAAADTLRQRGIATRRTGATRPFHNPALAHCVDAVAAVLDGVELRPPAIPLYSTATGRQLTAAEATDPKFWADQIVQPVRYADAAAALLANDQLLIEAGPGTVLGTLIRRHPAVRSGQSSVVGSLPAAVTTEDADLAALWQAAGRLWAEGHNPVWTALGLAKPTVRVDLPHYPYQRKRYWIDPAEPAAAPAGKPAQAGDRPAPESASGVGEADRDRAGESADAAATEAETSAFSLVTWVAAAATDHPPTPGRVRTALVLLPDDPAAALTVVRALHLAGLKTVRVRRGSAFNAGEEFTVRWGATEDVARLVHELVDRGVTVDTLVHATTAHDGAPCDSDSVDAALDASFHSLLDLVQHGSHAGGGQRLPELLVLTCGAVDVSGAENSDPAKAMLLGAVRTLAKETPWQACRLVDFAAAISAENLGEELARPADGDPVVALRGHRRWVPRETPFDPTVKDTEPIRPNGVYLITGGLGGIGLRTARALAETGRCPNLVLVGRHVPVAEPDESDTASRALLATFASLESLGATVRTVACDVADARGLRRALDLAGAWFGRVDGVFHFAGVAGDGMLAVRNREAAAEVLRPKVRGTLLLAEALRGGAAPDFLVLSSSRAAHEGLVGSGDYAAANAFLDAMAAGSAALPGRTLSIGFPSWSEVGMAARPSAAAGRPATEPESVVPNQNCLVWTTVLSAESTWVLDEHRLAGVPVLPGTGYIDIVVRAFRESVAAVDGQPTLVLSDIVFAAPLRAPTPHDVRVEFTPAEDGHAFVVISRAHGETAWVRHVTGRIGWSAETPGDQADLPALRARIPQRALPDLDDPNRMFTLGSRWRSCTTLHSGGDERLVELDLPEPLLGDLAEHPLHPAILDCSTAALRDPEETPHVPFLYPRLVMFGELPGRATAHVRRTWTRAGVLTGDVDVYDAEGRPVVAVTGFTMRNVDMTFNPGPAGKSRRPPAATGGLAAGQGIPPETGCELILRLLAARAHGHVLVRPFQDGRPVPLADALGAVAAPPPALPVAAPQPAASVSPVAPPPAKAEAQSTADEFLTRLHGLWTESLGIDTLGPDDDFFDLGGNSLSAVELLSRIRSEFGVELNVGLLYDAPTPRQLAESVARSAR
jgi:acyl transferase domain-containing protein/acyl carrier protein